MRKFAKKLNIGTSRSDSADDSAGATRPAPAGLPETVVEPVAQGAAAVSRVVETPTTAPATTAPATMATEIPSQRAAEAAVAAVLTSGGPESVGFLNDLVGQMWSYINVAGSNMVKEIVEPMFKDMLPGPLKTLHFNKIDLGPKPFVFDNVDVHTISKDTIKLDIDVKWDSEMDVELDADLIPAFGVESFKLEGRVSVLFRPLVPRLPLIAAQQIAFINPPEIEMDFTGAAQIADLSIIDDTIRQIIGNIINGILVLPNRLLVKIDPTCTIYDAYMPPLGFARIKVESGMGFKTTGRLLVRDVPDVYCVVKFGANKPWRTSTKNNDETPEWNEAHDFLLADQEQEIDIQVYDNDLVRDTFLGRATTTISEILLAGKRKTLELETSKTMIKGRKPESAGISVTVSVEIFELTTDGSGLQVDPSGEAETETLNTGLLTILVPGARGLTGAREDLATSAKICYGDNVFMTGVVADVPGVDVNNPAFEVSYRIPMTADTVAKAEDIKFTFMNKQKPIGEYIVKFEDVMAAPEMCLDGEHPIEGGGHLVTRVQLNGMKLSE